MGEDVFDAATAKKYEGLLEKKWTSVVRLQKKVGSRFSHPLDMPVASPRCVICGRLFNNFAVR